MVTVLAIPLDIGMHARLQLRGLGLTKMLINMIRRRPLGCFARAILLHERPT